MKKTAIFTTSAANYFAYSRTLLRSVKDVHGDVDRFFLLADEVADITPFLDPDTFEAVTVDKIGIPDYRKMAFVYNLVEFNTAVKPFFIQHLFARGYEKVIYLDPDIMVLDRLDAALEALNEHSIVVTPHQLAPLGNIDGFKPDMAWETAALGTGIFNLGFIAVANTDEGRAFVDWWLNRCHYFCFVEAATGLFVDQKWVNLAPCYFKSLHILRHKGYNMAVWNLHERRLVDGKVNGEVPLVFYHFSSFDIDDEVTISKHKPKITIAEHEELRDLFARYRRKLFQNGYNDSVKIPYGFGCYKDGTKIGALARKMFVHVYNSAIDPFTVPGRRIFAVIRAEYNRDGSRQQGNDGKLEAFTKYLLRMSLMLFGESFYCLLIDSLGKMINMRNHKFLLK
jgi:hypothetical protein